MEKARKAADLLASNLRMLMKKNKLSRSALAKRCGVSPRHLAYILASEKSATIDVLERIARVFGLECWQLISRDLTDSQSVNSQVSKVIHEYVQATEDGRELILKIAEREAKYRTKPT